MPTNTWHLTIDVSDIWKAFQENGFEQSVKLVIARIKQSGWRELTFDPDAFDELLANLGESAEPGEFNGWWSELYDLADVDRVWVSTF